MIHFSGTILATAANVDYSSLKGNRIADFPLISAGGNWQSSM
jgi:hypothetical protein